MGAFILAGLIFVVSLGASALVLVGESHSVGTSWAAIFIGGASIVVLVLASHWMLAMRS